MSATFHMRLEIEGAQSEAWHLARICVRERVDAPFEATIEAKHGEVVDVDALLGKAATLEWKTKDDLTRSFFGVVSEAAIEARGIDAFELRVTVVPRLALLALGERSRIFTGESPADVIAKVLDEAGCPCSLSMRETFGPRPAIVQSRETDLDFVKRLAASVGASFVVRCDQGEDETLFFDDASAFEPVVGETIILHRSETRLDGLSADRTCERVAIRPDRVMLRDYDPSHARRDLDCKSEADDAKGRELYFHPGGYFEKSEGDCLASARLDASRWDRRAIRFSSDAAMIAPSRTFSLGAHERGSLALELVAVEVIHRADADGVAYENEVLAVPAETPLRPAAFDAREPNVLEAAFVTVPGGEEIHCDDLGRVKVRYAWDRSGRTDDTSFAWLRVGQPPLEGSMVIPRGGFEVVVAEEPGGTSRPCVIGHLYNKEAPPPYALPAAATQTAIESATTGGGPRANTMRFEDAAGAESISLLASKDLVTSVGHDSLTAVGNDEKVAIGGNRTTIVSGSMQENVTGARSLSVGGNAKTATQGDLADGIGGNLEIAIGAARDVHVGGDLTESVGGDLERSIGSLDTVIAINGYERKTTGDSKMSVGAAHAEIAAKSRMLTIGGAYSETIGAAKLIKSKDMSVTCEGAYAMTAAAERVKVGKSRTDEADGAVAMTAAGTIKIKAESASFSAKSKIVVRGGGCTLTLTSAGVVTLSAPNIVIAKSKALAQVMHKSN